MSEPAPDNTPDTTPHTTREIHSQPALWQTLAQASVAEFDDIRQWITQLDISEVWFTGAGTSAFIGDILAAALNALSIYSMRSISSTDLVSAPQLYINRKSKSLPHPLVVSFGRSGNSSETVGVLNLLDQHLPQAPRLNITCNGSSELATHTHPSNQQRVIILPAHDTGFAMTASFSCMLLSATSVFDSQMSDCADTLRRLSSRANTLLSEATRWADSCAQPSRMVFLGSGCLQYAAREATLKVMELTAGQVPALWDSPLGFRHGPKSFIDQQTHVVLFESQNEYSQLYDRDLAQEIRTQFPDNRLTIISHHTNADLTVEPELPDHWNSVLYTLTAQVLAVALSQRLQLNVDDPFIGTNTLTRVVSGVTLHAWPAD